MAYDEHLADRIRQHLPSNIQVEEKKMFGGIAFMVNGKMCVGVIKEDLMVRMNPEQEEVALARKGARPMDFTGRPMKGYIYVSPIGIDQDTDLNYWLSLALEFNKVAKASKKKKPR